MSDPAPPSLPSPAELDLKILRYLEQSYGAAPALSIFAAHGSSHLVNMAIVRLESAGLIVSRTVKEHVFCALTDKGRAHLARNVPPDPDAAPDPAPRLVSPLASGAPITVYEQHNGHAAVSIGMELQGCARCFCGWQGMQSNDCPVRNQPPNLQNFLILLALRELLARREA